MESLGESERSGVEDSEQLTEGLLLLLREALWEGEKEALLHSLPEYEGEGVAEALADSLREKVGGRVMEPEPLTEGHMLLLREALLENKAEALL